MKRLFCWTTSLNARVSSIVTEGSAEIQTISRAFDNGKMDVTLNSQDHNLRGEFVLEREDAPPAVLSGHLMTTRAVQGVPDSDDVSSYLFTDTRDVREVIYDVLNKQYVCGGLSSLNGELCFVEDDAARHTMLELDGTQLRAVTGSVAIDQALVDSSAITLMPYLKMMPSHKSVLFNGVMQAAKQQVLVDISDRHLVDAKLEFMFPGGLYPRVMEGACSLDIDATRLLKPEVGNAGSRLALVGGMLRDDVERIHLNLDLNNVPLHNKVADAIHNMSFSFGEHHLIREGNDYLEFAPIPAVNAAPVVQFIAASRSPNDLSNLDEDPISDLALTGSYGISLKRDTGTEAGQLFSKVGDLTVNRNANTGVSTCVLKQNIMVAPEEPTEPSWFTIIKQSARDVFLLQMTLDGKKYNFQLTSAQIESLSNLDFRQGQKAIKRLFPDQGMTPVQREELSCGLLSVFYADAYQKHWVLDMIPRAFSEFPIPDLSQGLAADPYRMLTD